MKHFWKKYHKWVGLFFTFFILMFCFSGIVLNHRAFFSGCEISRSWMPDDYRYQNWNNGCVRGTLKLATGELLAYGNTGVWSTDSCFSAFTPLNNGIDDGIDNRKISDIVQMPDGSVWCSALFDIYRLEGKEWKKQIIEGHDERMTDITRRNDTLVVMSRSYVYQSLPPYTHFEKQELKAPQNYSPKVSLFRTVWVLHSGELFGLPGKLFVDFIALVIIVLCVTGLLYTFLPKAIRRRKQKKQDVKPPAKLLKFSFKWHNRLGAWLIFFIMLLAVTGMCLRPPLMIPLAITQVKPVPFSTFDSENAWHDKLRAVRWDEAQQKWLMSTSQGFYAVSNWGQTPEKLKNTPPVSPMGINVFHQTKADEWLVGSFSGLFRWNMNEGKVTDYFTGEPVKVTFGPPVSRAAVSGISVDLDAAPEAIFQYGKGAVDAHEQQFLPIMDEQISSQPMSLWNFALELHVGRCYTPFLGPFSVLFVFLSGLLLSFILLSGYIVYKKRKR